MTKTFDFAPHEGFLLKMKSYGFAGPLCVDDIFRAIHHGKPFLFADNIKIAYSFELPSLPQTMVKIMEDLNLIDDWCAQWAMKFSVTQSVILTFKCHVSPDGLFISDLPILTTPCVIDLGI